MNRPIARLFGLVVILFALLVAFTSRWTVFEAKSLRNSSLNRRQLLAEQRIHRGRIEAADGTILARSKRAAGGVFFRTYPSHGLFAHAVGYSYVATTSQTGLEASRNDALSGKRTGINTILDQLQGKARVGDDVITTLDPRAQRAAISALAGQQGAIVALDPSTGAIKAMASEPSFDPNGLGSAARLRALSTDQARKPLVNRVTQFGYAPGSTFKIVTASAALDTGTYTPQSSVDGRDNVPISGVGLANDNHASYGTIDLTTALAKSVNTVYAQVAVHLGKGVLARYMERFGFDHKPALDYPTNQMSSSGEYRNGVLLNPRSTYVDVGRMGIGQDKLQVTPLQMVQVAAAVANRGRLMTPHLTDRIVDPDGRTITKVTPTVQRVVMKASTAAEVSSMMQGVVDNGTGTAAQIPGVKVAGKTGTAETQLSNTTNNVWFIAFAPAEHPRVAIAVTLQHVQGLAGATAAPVAKQVIQAMLHG
ncbi:MAG TPA: penicillin-binding protein 2 [Solirubrobacteraceae bacterium]|jgi:peptidoglycan glycosyltransferase|nr:penicillin-binding protein 2 [Solirubrobacteraceae bacterium]